MTRLRFHSAQSLFETFPELDTKITVRPKDEPPLAFARDLRDAGEFGDAVTFCAFLLGRRESVWWACRSVRTLLPDGAQQQAVCLLAAETWAQKPTDENREIALRIGAGAGDNEPVTWLARAAGWAGGMILTNPNNPHPVPHYMTARANRIAVLLSARFISSSEQTTRLKACIDDAINLAQTGL